MASIGPDDKNEKTDLDKADDLKNTLDKDNMDIGDIKNTLDKDNADLGDVKNALDKDNVDVGDIKNTLDKDNADLGDVKNALDKDNADLDEIKNTVDKDNADLDEIKNTVDKDTTKNTLDKDNADLDSIKNAPYKNNAEIINEKNTLDKDNKDLTNVKNTLDKDNAGLTNAKNAIDKDNADITNINNALDKDNADVPAPAAAPAPKAGISAPTTPGSTTPPSAPPPQAQAPARPGFLSRAWSQIKDYGSRAYEAVSNAASSIRDRFSSSPAVAPPQTTAATVPPAPPHPAIQKDGLGQGRGLDAGQQVGVQFGTDEAHLMPKGQGLQTGGKLESIDHDGGKATVHFKAGSHEQVLSVNEKSPDGKALSEALDHIKPGDKMSLKIGHDVNQKESIEVADKTSGFHAIVHDGKVEEKNEIPGRNRGLDVNR
jgi:hypothetical protein